MTNKSEILAEIARSRAAIARDSAMVRMELDITKHLKNSVKTRPFAWLGGAAAIGYILAGPKTRTKTVIKTVKPSNLGAAVVETKPARTYWDILIALFKMAIPLLKPLISVYAARRVGAFAEKLQRS